MEYVIGRGNWIKSIAVGVIGALAMVIGMIVIVPIMIVGAVVIFVLGISGFLKRDE